MGDELNYSLSDFVASAFLQIASEGRHITTEEVYHAACDQYPELNATVPQVAGELRQLAMIMECESVSRIKSDENGDPDGYSNTFIPNPRENAKALAKKYPEHFKVKYPRLI